ncbi:hypothetical protein Gotur_032156 [Gossypium turneri]
MEKTLVDADFKQPVEAESTMKSTVESNHKQIEAISNPENIQKKLKYLDFIQVVSIYVVVCVSSIYEYAKENSGPLKPGVQTVEETVKTVIGPVYDKFRDVPFELLKFVDCKVDKSLSQLERHVPSRVKQASSQARTVASEVQRVGVVDVAKSITRDIYTKYKLTAKAMYDKYEPVAEQYAVFAWRSLNRLPFFPQVAQVVLPTTAYWSEKYNQVVQHFGENGYVVAAYLPLIPINRIAKVFIDDGRAPVVSSNGESVDELLSPFECHVPFVVKHASSQARTVASKVQRVRVIDAAKSITRNVYTKYRPTAKEMYDKYEKYNQVVQQSREKWCVVAAYLPLGPNDIITKVFMDNRGAPIISSNGESI